MRATLNGQEVELVDQLTVAALVAAHADSPRGIAVAINDELVPRSAWDGATVQAGDGVELVVAAQGG